MSTHNDRKRSLRYRAEGISLADLESFNKVADAIIHLNPYAKGSACAWWRNGFINGFSGSSTRPIEMMIRVHELEGEDSAAITIGWHEGSKYRAIIAERTTEDT